MRNYQRHHKTWKRPSTRTLWATWFLFSLLDSNKWLSSFASFKLRLCSNSWFTSQSNTDGTKSWVLIGTRLHLSKLRGKRPTQSRHWFQNWNERMSENPIFQIVITWLKLMLIIRNVDRYHYVIIGGINNDDNMTSLIWCDVVMTVFIMWRPIDVTVETTLVFNHPIATSAVRLYYLL